MSSKITPAMYKAKLQENFEGEKAMQVNRAKILVESLEKDIDNALETGGRLDNIKIVHTTDVVDKMDYFCGPNKPYHIFASEWMQVLQRYADVGWRVCLDYNIHDVSGPKVVLSVKEK